MIGLLFQAEETLAAKIPSFTERFNFTLPLIVVLLIVMFFLLLKSYSSESTASADDPTERGREQR